MQTGDEVQATKQIDELGENGETIVHARVGDIGQVLEVFPIAEGEAWIMVAWSGGACQCHTDEVRPTAQPVACECVKRSDGAPDFPA